MEFIKSFVLSILVRLGFISKPELVARIVARHPLQEAIEPGFIYIVGGRHYQKWAYLRCPADRSEVIQLCLLAKHRPRWTVTVDRLGRPTIYPSVRQLNGSFAHFWVKSGRIEWCFDSGTLVNGISLRDID
ncbi:MAG TPA: DUF6527 family protein [Myxococcota bacterium]|nr:DUF6527 family protein [Myxococcota bacterium]